MEFRAYFKQMDSSLPLFAYAEKKVSEKVEKFVRNPVEGHITFCVDNGNSNKIHFHLVAGGGFNFDLSSAHEASMYSAVDLLVDKLEKKLRRHKERLKHRKFKRKELDLNKLDVLALRDYREEFEDEPIDASYIINFEKARQKGTEPSVPH